MTAPAVLAVLALVHPGQPVSQLDLHDAGVWLTNTSTLQVGRYSSTVDELNAGLVAASGTFDVLQDDGDVLLAEPGRLSRIDPAAVTAATGTTVPDGAQVSMAAGTVAVVDPADGSLWAGTVDALDGLRTDGRPDLALGPGGAAVVSDRGTVLAVAADGTRSTVTVGGGDATARTVGGHAAGMPASEDDAASAGTTAATDAPGRGAPDQVTAVGESLVTLTGRTLGTPRGDVDLSAYGEPLRLQQPGPDAATVLVAGPTALLEVPLGGGEVRSTPSGGSGRPAAPVRVGDCAHAAWAAAIGGYLSRCDGRAPQIIDLEGMTSADTLVFRVNRGVVVLNDTARGRLWVPTEDPRLREPSWDDIRPEPEQREDATDADAQQGLAQVAAECTAEAAAPAAADDAYGVRPGRTSVLTVLDNDSSSDCGVLVISQWDELPPDVGTLSAVHGGRALQLVPADGASGTALFTYTVTDGRGSTAPATATVRLTVRSAGEDDRPEQVRVDTVVVEEGAEVSVDVLPAFVDPDGDDLLLLDASSDGGTVRTRPDGRVTFLADRGALGPVDVRLVVSDGAHAVDGVLHVDVRARGSLAPVVDPVHATGYVGEPVTVAPLAAVRSGTLEPPRLAAVEPLAGVTVTQDLAAGTFAVTAPRPGTYYLTFVVTAAPHQVTGLARVDVRERPEASTAPVAVADRALLPPGGEVTVDPLANDVDPRGDVLVLQSAQAPEGSGLQVAVLEHGLLRISAVRVPDAPVVVHYVVSNGTATARGEVLVRPVPATATPQGPVVPDATATVRAGGVVTIPVLDGAHDPDGGPLTLERTLTVPLGPGQGLLFVSGDVLRYRAPDRPTTARAAFRVVDADGNATDAALTVTVHAAAPGTKAPPRPVPVTGRVFAGETVRIPVPLVGIDPDGDGVTLLGLDRPPAKGIVTEVGADWLEYRALPGALGTDEFTYAVEDWVGQRAVATVRVGIADRPTTAPDVVARDDEVVVRPGRTVEVGVLANDVDAGGDDLRLGAELGAPPEVDARVDGDRIVVRAPDAPGVVPILYTATTDRGGRGSAVLTVDVREDAPVLPPVATDVVVPAIETIGRTRVEVDVLAGAVNPSGPASDLRVSVPAAAGAAATVTADGSVVVTLAHEAQTLPYVLTNAVHPDAGSTTAFITVPALGDFPPTRRPRAPELRVLAGAGLVIPLAEQVQVAPGRTARITDEARVTATRSDGSDLAPDRETLTFRAPRDYAGPASITVEVTDETGPGDAGARVRVLTLPITVLAADDHPPAFVPSTIDVAPGEAPVVVDLAAFTSAPVGPDASAAYRYALTTAVPPGFTVTLDGSRLTVSADAGTARGTFGSLGLTVGYGRAGSLPARVELRVSASARPLARVRDAVVADGVEDRTSTVAVLDGAFNPFPDTPLTVVAATVETPGAGTAAVTGSAVSVRPAPGFVGSMVTRFRVRDVTGDPAREVEGRVTVVVRGRPATPGTPRVVEVRDRTVVLAWDAPAANGEPITAYRVTARPGGEVRECAGTTCTLEGLVNDTEYTFTVAARNAVDWSEESAPSAPARPDARPDAPGAPVLEPGDRQLTATWTPPRSPGSAVDRYTVEISPAPPAGAVLTTTATTVTVRGLTNGVEHVVRVRAHNRAPDPGEWSAWSPGAVPAGVPAAPAVTATRHSAGGFTQTGRIDVAWTAPADNGAAISGYEVAVDGATVAVLPASATAWTLDPAERGRAYTVAVRARNAAGWSTPTAVPATTWSAPSEPRDAVATDAGATPAPWGDGSVVLGWQPPADAGGTGITVTGYEVEGIGRVSGTSVTVGGLTAGPSPEFRVRAWSSRDEASAWVTIASVAVVTAPQAPAVTADALPDGTVRLVWTPARDGGSPLTALRYRVEGQDWVEVAPTEREATVATGATAGRTLRVEVQAVNGRGASPVGWTTVTVPAEDGSAGTSGTATQPGRLQPTRPAPSEVAP